MFEELWSFVVVLVVAVLVAGTVSALYANGLRLWARSETSSAGRSFRRVSSVLCFAACVAIVAVALWLIIPAFHS